MNSRTYPEEVRSEWIADLTSVHAAAIRQALAAGEPQTLVMIADRWSDLIGNDSLAQQIVRSAVAIEPQESGAFVLRLVEQIIVEFAAKYAEAEVEQLGKDRSTSADEDRIDRGAWARAMAKLPELSRI